MGHKVSRDHKVNKVLLDHRDLKDHRVNKVLLDHRDHRDLKDHRVNKVLLDHRDLKDQEVSLGAHQHPLGLLSLTSAQGVEVRIFHL
jgi:hypothetical protein